MSEDPGKAQRKENREYWENRIQKDYEEMMRAQYEREAEAHPPGWMVRILDKWFLPNR